MYNKKTWEDFRDTGLLWWINQLLHTFGWSIVIEMDDNKEIIDVYPARVTFRGFPEQSNTTGYLKLSKYMKDNAEVLYRETMED